MIRNSDSKKTGEKKQGTMIRPAVPPQPVLPSKQPTSIHTNQPVPSPQKGNAKMGTFRRLWHLEQ